MTCTSIYAGSLEPVRVRVAKQPNLSTYPVEMAFLSEDEDRPTEAGDWHVAEWEGENVVSVLIGPGSTVELTPGRWYVWVKVQTPDSLPIFFVGVQLIN